VASEYLVTATEKAGDTEIRANVPVIFGDKGIGLGAQMFHILPTHLHIWM
jgi:hypothetical protein